MEESGQSREYQSPSERARANVEAVVVNGRGPVSPADRGASGGEPEDELVPSPREKHPSEELPHEETGAAGENNNSNNNNKRAVEMVRIV